MSASVILPMYSRSFTALVLIAKPVSQYRARRYDWASIVLRSLPHDARCDPLIEIDLAIADRATTTADELWAKAATAQPFQSTLA